MWRRARCRGMAAADLETDPCSAAISPCLLARQRDFRPQRQIPAIAQNLRAGTEALSSWPPPAIRAGRALASRSVFR